MENGTTKEEKEKGEIIFTCVDISPGACNCYYRTYPADCQLPINKMCSYRRPDLFQSYYSICYASKGVKESEEVKGTYCTCHLKGQTSAVNPCLVHG